MRPQDRGGTTDGGWAATCGETPIDRHRRPARPRRESKRRTDFQRPARPAGAKRTSGAADGDQRRSRAARAWRRRPSRDPASRRRRPRAERRAHEAPVRSARGPGALGLGQALGVGREQRDHAGGERGGERGAKRQPAQGAQQLVGVDREAGERADEDQQRDLQRDHRPVHDRLDGEVALPERAEVAEPREHGQPVAGDEHVDRARSAPTTIAAVRSVRVSWRPTPAPYARAEHGEQQREQDQRMEAAPAWPRSAPAPTARRRPRAAACRGLARRR